MLTAQHDRSRREERYTVNAQLLPSTRHAARNTERSASQPQPSSVCLKVFTHPKAAMVSRLIVVLISQLNSSRKVALCRVPNTLHQQL